VYQRLPDEQRDRLHRQVRSLLESRLNEIRQNLNI
jgi:predicted ATPase